MRWASTAVVAAAALAVAVSVFGEALPNLHDHFLGVEEVDHYGTQWFFWFTEQAFFGDAGLGKTDLYFYPWGKDIYGHTGANVLDALLAIPFRRLLGHTLGYNTFCLFSLLVNGLAFDRLARDITSDWRARIAASTLYALNPYFLAELLEGRPTQVFQPFIPLLFHHVLHLREPGFKHIVLAALNLALTGLTYWYYAFFAGFVVVGHFVGRIGEFRHEPKALLQFFLRHAGVALVALVMVLPFAYGMLEASSSGETTGLLKEPDSLFSMGTTTEQDITIGLFLFFPFQRVNGFMIDLDGGGTAFNPIYYVYTYTQMLIAVIGLWVTRRRGLFLGLLAFSLVLALGPYVALPTEARLPNPFYIALVKTIPFLRRLWWAGRATTMTALVTSMMAVVALGWASRRYGHWAGALAAVLTLGGFGYELRQMEASPFPQWTDAVPEGYRCLGELEEKTPIIELPYGLNQAHLYYQIKHGHPLFGGMVEDNPVFTPPEQLEVRQTNTWIKAIFALAARNFEKGLVEIDPADKQAMYDLGYRYVVLQHRAFMRGAPKSGAVDVTRTDEARLVNKYLTRLIGPPVWQDPDITIHSPWGLPSPCGRKGPGRNGDLLLAAVRRLDVPQGFTIGPPLGLERPEGYDDEYYEQQTPRGAVSIFENWKEMGVEPMTLEDLDKDEVIEQAHEEEPQLEDTEAPAAEEAPPPVPPEEG